MVVLPTTVILNNFCCDAPFKVLFAFQQLASQFTQSKAKGRTLVQHEFYRAFLGTRMQRINPDLISANLFNPCHLCPIYLLNIEPDV
jgi:hypothetical protein